MIFIDRQNRRDIPRAGAEIISVLSDGEGVIVFPEGTTTKGDDVIAFNSSFLQFAAETDLPSRTPRSRTGRRTASRRRARPSAGGTTRRS
jgi:1-acyl-sn-glycerol-3-phosphate acyltransferase